MVNESNGSNEPAANGDLIYVSWGGTGRGASLRAAYDRAADDGKGLVYLAILDPPHFQDLDHNLAQLVAEELRWLLQAHIRLVASSAYRSIPASVVVRIGEVDDEVEAMVAQNGSTQVLVGAPVSTSRHRTVGDLVQALRDRTGVAVDVVQPDEGTANL